MPGLALDLFERQAEGFARARAWREWQFQSGARPGRGLVKLYDEDFPDFTSRDLYADLQDAADAEPRRKRALSCLLAAANIEGNTREFATRSAAFVARTTLTFEGEELAWREAPARLPLIGDVPRRHALAETWRDLLRQELNPVLEQWHEALRAALPPLGGGDDWIAFWSDLRGIDASGTRHLAESVLQLSDGVYQHALGVYLAQRVLPIDDAWTADLAWALRAPRFDATFSHNARMPVLIRSMRDFAIELEDQLAVHIEPGPLPGVHCLAVDVPSQVRVMLRLGGGWLDYARSLRGLGSAEHVALTDPSLPFWQRWLGDDTPGIGYGLLLEGLVRDRTWLVDRLAYPLSDDYRVIAHIAWLYRVRRVAALALFEQRMWQAEPGGALASDFEEALSTSVHVHHFADEYLLGLLNAPWTPLRSALWLRAELFAAQVRLFLQREFDEEWWRSNRAARFVREELWRIGRRHTAEELLGFMGYEGFDASVLWSAISEVLAPL